MSDPGGGGWDWKLLPALAEKALVAHRKACVPFCQLLTPDPSSCVPGQADPVASGLVVLSPSPALGSKGHREILDCL